MRALRPLIVAALALATGCEDCDANPYVIPLPADQVDVFAQKTAAKVDILWMMDDSGSMAAKQAKVAGRFNEFFRQLVTSQVDYHIGVITSDPADLGVLRQYPQSAPSVDGCAGCRFLTPDVACANPDVVLSPTATDDEVEAQLAQECEAQLVFRRLILTGTAGSSFEEGFRVAAMALGVDVVDPETSLPEGDGPPENAGFLRPDASLFIIFVSDEDEGGKATDGTPIKYYQRLFEGLKERGDENRVSVSAITGWPTDDAVPRLERVCGILAGDDDVERALIEQTFSDPVGNACHDVTGSPDDEEGRAEAGGRYIQLACATGGVVSNMCESDYSSALDRLGATAAGLARKFTLSSAEIEAGADCELFTDDDASARLDCNENGTTNDACIDDVICVTATPLGSDGEPTLIPRFNCDANGQPLGPPNWSYEPGTSSVRFEGSLVPAPGTEVTIRYPLREPTRGCP